AMMHFRGHHNKANLARIRVFRPPDSVPKRGAVRRRIPFHNDQLGRDAMPPRLFNPSVDKRLKPAKQIAAVVIVSGGDYQGKVAVSALSPYFGVAVKHKCQPNARSRARKSFFGIQRKYQTLRYRYCTYSGIT